MTANTPPPAMQSPAPAPAKNGFATAGFVLGLLGLIFSFIPFIGIIAWPLVILGLIFAILGLVRARKGAPNKGLSIAGIACSAAGLVLCILMAAAFTTAVNEAVDEAQQSNGTHAVSEGSSQGQDDSTKPDAGIGEPVSDGMFEFTVTKVETGIQHVGNDVIGEDAQGQWVIVHVDVTNTGDEPRSLNMAAQKLYDAKGRAHNASSGTAAMALPNSEAFLNNINPGNSVEAQLLFDVPKDVQLASIELHDSMMSGGVTVSLQEA